MKSLMGPASAPYCKRMIGLIVKESRLLKAMACRIAVGSNTYTLNSTWLILALLLVAGLSELNIACTLIRVYRI